jgi:branched-chain amino acid aminotransferase
VFIIRGGQVQTPTTSDGILEGVTRRVMIEICRKLAIECIEKSLQRIDLYSADEMFLTGTGGEVMPVTKIDGRAIGSGEVGAMTRRLKDAFHHRARE